MAAKRTCRITRDSTVFLQCDIQELAKPKMWNMQSVLFVAKMMAHAAHVMDIPLVVSEHIPEKLGRTVEEVRNAWRKPPTLLIQKFNFTMCCPELFQVLEGKKSVVLYGVETHVCVQHTCLELLELGFEVHILVDGVTSMYPVARSAAIARMRDAGATVETYESVLTEICSDMNDPKAQIVGQYAMKNRQKEPLMPSL